MAKYEGTYSCGHSGVINVIGKMRERQRKIDYVFSQICPKCAKEERERKIAEENKNSKELSHEYGFPELTGTEKQIAWANTIRLNFYNEFENYAATQEIIENETKSSFWLDLDRFSSKKDFLRKYEQNKREKEHRERIIDIDAVAPEKLEYEGVVEIVEARSLGGIAGHCNKLHIGIFLSSLQAEGLMAVGVGDDDLAALVNAVDAGVIAGLVFADGVFPDDVVLADAQNLGGFLDTLDMGVGVAFVFVADQNDADLDVGADSIAGGLSRSLFLGGSLGLFSGGFGGLGGFSRSGLGRGVVRLGGGSAGNQREDHDYGEKQSDDLFHVFVPPKKFCGKCRNPAA